VGRLTNKRGLLKGQKLKKIEKVHVGYQNKGNFTLTSSLVVHKGFATKGIPWNISLYKFLLLPVNSAKGQWQD